MPNIVFFPFFSSCRQVPSLLPVYGVSSSE